MTIHGVAVHGVDLDGRSRCRHYRSALDIVAIQFFCCRKYYACRQCHDDLADHPARLWPPDAYDQVAILCGACGQRLSIRAYLSSGHRCPACGAAFNPGCARHHHLYFAGPAPAGP